MITFWIYGVDKLTYKGVPVVYDHIEVSKILYIPLRYHNAIKENKKMYDEKLASDFKKKIYD